MYVSGFEKPSHLLYAPATSLHKPLILCSNNL